MGRTLWTIFVCGSLLALIGYFGHTLFSDPSVSKKSKDPFEALLETAPESLRNPSETGQGTQHEPEPVKREDPIEAKKDVSSDAVIHSALFQPNDLNVEMREPHVTHEQIEAQLGNIQRELSQLPGGPESAPARTVLLHSASTLDLDDKEADQVHELAMNELLQGTDDEAAAASPSSSFAYFLPVLAHEVALKTALDSTEALSITIDGLTVHHDPGIRYSLMRQFVSRYPQLESQLREELYLRNIPTDTPQILSAN
jgi:hypothetical protein